jgi:hypothetical protein
MLSGICFQDRKRSFSVYAANWRSLVRQQLDGNCFQLSLLIDEEEKQEFESVPACATTPGYPRSEDDSPGPLASIPRPFQLGKII